MNLALAPAASKLRRSRAPKSARQQVTDAKLAGGLRSPECLTLTGETRGARSDKEPTHFGEGCNKILGHPIGQRFLGGIPADIAKGQNRDRRMIGQQGVIAAFLGEACRPFKPRFLTDRANKANAFGTQRADEALPRAAIANRAPHMLNCVYSTASETMRPRQTELTTSSLLTTRSRLQIKNSRRSNTCGSRGHCTPSRRNSRRSVSSTQPSNR